MESVGRRSILAALATTAVLVVAGCGDDEESDTAAEETTDTTTEQAGGGGATVDVSAVDFAFEPSDPSVDEDGAVSIELTNDGQAPHALEVEELEEATDTIDPGQSTTLDVDLDSGEYTIYCPVDDHRAQGMEGTLTVGSGGGGGGAASESEDESGTETETESEDDSGGSGGGY